MNWRIETNNKEHFQFFTGNFKMLNQWKAVEATEFKKRKVSKIRVVGILRKILDSKIP